MAATNRNRIIFYGTVLMALAFIVGGVAMIYQGNHAYNEVLEDLRNENLSVPDPIILSTYDDARAPEGVEVPMVTIDTWQEADAQARVIRTHTMSSTGGKTYTEMDREDPGRALYITSLTLQNSLHMAHLGIHVTYFVMGTGLAFAGLGAGMLLFWLPVVRKVLAI